MFLLLPHSLKRLPETSDLYATKETKIGFKVSSYKVFENTTDSRTVKYQFFAK